MYTKYFGLKKRPFVLSPDPAFLYLSRVHDLAFTHLEYGLSHHAGFVALTGEVGTGKTTLLKYLFDKVKTSLEIAMIFNTQLDPQALLEMLVREFGLDTPSGSKAAFVDVLYGHFLKQYSRGNRCVIVIDEAQNLPLEAFEELRMLSNLEAGNDVLLQIILVGQPQLRERLAHPSLAQLTQRISVHYHLAPLSRDEVGNYVAHRLNIAGYERPEPLFAEAAVARVAELSRGIPRVINSICDASLTYAFADELAQVSTEVVDKVIADNELLLVGFRSDEPQAALDSSALSLVQSTAMGPAAMSSEVQSLLSRLTGRLEALEMRMQMLESDRRNGTVAVLQEMLDKERERTLQYAQQITSLSSQYREVQSQFAELKQQRTETESKAKSGRHWRIFGREKEH
jgi:general secretion pathway protein A